MSLLVKGGLVFVNGSFVKKDILIGDEGEIADIGASLKGDETFKATGLLVLPGLIDPHVHLREPGDTYKEDFVTGGKAAIAGGFTTVIDMPNNKIPTTTNARLDEKKDLAKKALCDVLFHFGGTDDNFAEVKKANPASMKLYLGHTTGGLILRKPDSLERHFKEFPKNRPIVLHACDHSENEAENLKETYKSITCFLSLAKEYRRKIHLAHASTAHEITITKSYPLCTTEVAPHHLFLSTKDREKLGFLYKVYPPLRSEQERIMLWNSLEKVDCIATDHAPHTIEDKEEGAAGFPGLETSFSLMFDAANKGLVDKEWLVKAMSENVADIFNVEGKGRLRKGFAGDVTIIDPKKEWVVERTELQTKCRWTPFQGKKLKGKVRTVIKSGKVVYEDGEFV
ncbi:dihydroorotase family protein [Candidatus Micrarchaeota archaeon]|nr:dihydroorotase family protein [Candidatus Micrarchaeota archaeon]